MADRDCYEVLGVARDATADQIKKAYRALARKHHPDANPGDKTAEAKFKEVQNAYDILSDAEKKSRYDQFGHAAFDGSGPFGPRGQGTEWAARQAGPGGFENIDFSSLFGGARPGGATASGDGAGIFEDIMTRMRGERGGRRRSPGQPRETEASLTIPFFTAVRGGETTIELDRGDGRLESKVIKIPPGLESGKKIRLRGQGDSAGQGDLVIHVTVEPHPYFHRDGQDITVEVPLTVAEAIKGFGRSPSPPEPRRARSFGFEARACPAPVISPMATFTLSSRS
jgi:DnaJ-class molecular chaperone